MISSRDLIDLPLNAEPTDRNFCAGVQSRCSMPRSFVWLTPNCKRPIASLPKTRSWSGLPLDLPARQFRIGSQGRHHLGQLGEPCWPAPGVRIDARCSHRSSLGPDVRSDYANDSRDTFGSWSRARRRTARSECDHVRQHRDAALGPSRQPPSWPSRPWEACRAGSRIALRARHSVLTQ
jgi:hypothetical protein